MIDRDFRSGTNDNNLVGGSDLAADDACEAARTPSADRRQRQEQLVTRLIQEVKATSSLTLDLSNTKINKIPDELLELSQLEYLYLEGNELTCLPSNFFDCLPCLKWLDLRHNYLASLPSTYIGRHQCLRTLLLEGNELRTLPLELGLVTTINGLNIANNPLEFPPQEVIAKGTQAVLAFFRELIKIKSQGKAPTDSEDEWDESDVPRIEDLRLAEDNTSSSSDEGGQRAVWRRKSSSYKDRWRANERSTLSGKHSELSGPKPHTLALHQPISYNELKQLQVDRLKRAGAMGVVDRNDNGSRKLKKIGSGNIFPADLADQRYLEEKRLAKLREMKEKEDMMLQRRKDLSSLSDFRRDSRKLQQLKQLEKIRKGRIDYDEPVKKAPFAVEKDHFHVMTNEERIAEQIRDKHEKIRRVLSPNTKQRMDEVRLARDRELEEKIKMHTSAMQERRRKPKGSPQQEMMLAKKELEIADALQRELKERRKELEYRFTAFTGEVDSRTRHFTKY